MPQTNSFQFFIRRTLEHQEVAGVEVGNQHQAAIGREFQAVRAFGLHAKRVDHAPGKEVDHRDSAIARVCHPELVAVGSNVETFRSFTYWDYSLVPALRAVALNQTDAVRPDVRGNDQTKSFVHGDHMRGVLARAEKPIHSIGDGVVSADYLISLGRKIKFAAGESQTVRTA